MRRVLVCCVIMAALALVPPSVQLSALRRGERLASTRRRSQNRRELVPPAGSGPQRGGSRALTTQEKRPPEEKARRAPSAASVANALAGEHPGARPAVSPRTSAAAGAKRHVEAPRTSPRGARSARGLVALGRAARGAPHGRASRRCAASWSAQRSTLRIPKSLAGHGERSAPRRTSASDRMLVSERASSATATTTTTRTPASGARDLAPYAVRLGPDRPTPAPPLRRRHGGAAGLGQDAGGHRHARRRECRLKGAVAESRFALREAAAVPSTASRSAGRSSRVR